MVDSIGIHEKDFYPRLNKCSTEKDISTAIQLNSKIEDYFCAVKFTSFLSFLLTVPAIIVLALPRFFANDGFAPQTITLSKTQSFDFVCNKFEKGTYTYELNNRIDDYIEISSKQGIPPQADFASLQKLVADKQLVEVKNHDWFVLDTFYYSFPFLTPSGLDFLEEIGALFENAIKNTPVEGVRPVVTSLTRTTSTVEKLVRVNRAASSRSPHMNGNSFDLSLTKFDFHRPLSDCEKLFLSETLAKVLLYQKEKGRCWTTFEKFQQCLHVVVNVPVSSNHSIQFWNKF